MPLFVLSGAPGSGKTAALAAIRERLHGVVVIDMDTFLDAASALAGADLRYAADRWPAYTELLRRVVATVVDSGADCLLLTRWSRARSRTGDPARWPGPCSTAPTWYSGSGWSAAG